MEQIQLTTSANTLESDFRVKCIIETRNAHQFGTDFVDSNFVSCTVRVVSIKKRPKALTVVHFSQVC